MIRPGDPCEGTFLKTELSNLWRNVLEEIGDLLRRFAADAQSISIDASRFPQTEDDLEEFVLDVRRAFGDGVNSAFHSEAVEYLQEKYGNQQAIADEIGKKDRTSISHWKKSKRIDGPDLTWLLTLHPQFTLPTREACMCSGYAAAITFTHNYLARNGAKSSESLSADQFYIIRTVLQDKTWLTAIFGNDTKQADSIEKQILADMLQKKAAGQIDHVPTHPELKYLVENWTPSFLVCIKLFPTPEVRR